jgi:hypothetical protein
MVLWHYERNLGKCLRFDRSSQAYHFVIGSLLRRALWIGAGRLRLDYMFSDYPHQGDYALFPGSNVPKNSSMAIP